MGFRVFGPFVFALGILAPLSCSNATSTSDGFGSDTTPNSPSGQGGGSGDGATGSSPAPTSTMSKQGTPEGGPAQTASSEGGASQSTNHDSGSGQTGPGNPQADSSVSRVDASTVDASVVDVAAVDSPNFSVADGCTQNLGCMLAPPASTGDIRQDCVNRINQFRTQCACLPALQRWTAGEMCADQEAQYDSTQTMAHAGFIATETACSQNGGGMWAACCSMGAFGSMPSADAQDECPGYPDNNTVISTCLQQMWNEGPPPNGETVQACEMDSAGCFQMHGHWINMTSMNTKVACGFYTTPSGSVYATQNFAP